jgi:hypothetical protein
MRHLTATLLLASLCACAGSYTNGPTELNPPDGGGTGSSDSGQPPDGGQPDGGDAGSDAGCVALSLNGVGAVDNCANAPNAVASVSVIDAGQGCAVSITLDTASTPCTGVASHGTLNAFDGGCAGSTYSCTSSSLPGTLNCARPGFSSCTIRICDAGVCSP